MAAVVNVLRFKEAPDPALFERAVDELGPQMRDIPGFQGFQVVRTADTEVVLLILAESTDVLDRIATEVGSPWMVANVVPLLAGPPERHIGDVIASATA
jgi:hypothetical protein